MPIIRVNQTGFEAGLKGEYYIPADTGNYTIVLPECMGYSDRCPSFAVSDVRAWAYWTAFTVGATFHVTRQANNSIHVTVDSFTNWQVKRHDTGNTPAGYRVVVGDYSFYSSINGALIYRYVGPSTSRQGDATWYGSGGTQFFDLGTIAAGTTSRSQEYGHSLNNINGLTSAAHLTVYNDLPPDYRPGERCISGTWRSLNRSGGVCERNASWYEMRTTPGNGDPPERMINGTWTNQSKLGIE